MRNLFSLDSPVLSLRQTCSSAVPILRVFFFFFFSPDGIIVALLVENV